MSELTAIQDEQILGRLLVEAGKLDAAGLERALRLRENSGERLSAILINLGLTPEREVAAALARLLDLPLTATLPDDPPVSGINPRFLKQARILPLHQDDAALTVAMADPLDRFAVQALELATGRAVQVQVGVASEIDAAVDRLLGGGKSQLGRLVDQAGDGSDEAAEDIERLKDLAGEAPVIRLVNLLITRAVEQRASDIHLEPFENTLHVRYRIDGALRPVEAPPPKLRAAVVSRLKIMARLNIAERRLPQDGRIKLAVQGREIDLRVSTVPTLYGESVVLRILDRGSVALDFDRLGLAADTLGRWREAFSRPNGIVLVTGPTGSGKTTTLYASLLELNTRDRKILTVEDPVEYRLEGINQIQVKPQIGLNFANILRSFLRQDPDVMMVGEIRDLETAETAVQAALTGHLVLSTLHTNGAAATITRLLDMGVAPYLISATINGIAAQRLVRTLCPDCRAPAPELAAVAGGRPVYKPVGCAACQDTGYRGRTMIVEMLTVDEPIRRLILHGADAAALHAAAIAAGMVSLHDDGLRKVQAGLTSLDEVLRVAREN